MRFAERFRSSAPWPFEGRELPENKNAAQDFSQTAWICSNNASLNASNSLTIILRYDNLRTNSRYA